MIPRVICQSRDQVESKVDPKRGDMTPNYQRPGENDSEVHEQVLEWVAVQGNYGNAASPLVMDFVDVLVEKL